jgi:aminomethyltransferase
MNSEPKKTPLYEEHVRLNGKMADFAGWLMPLWYGTGQVAEHHAVRNHCGMFDICHMGEFEIKGPDSVSFLSRLLSNNILKMSNGQAQYHFILNEKGGIIDDCILYRFDAENWMLVTNAGNIETDFNWLRAHLSGNIQLNNISDRTVKIDIQGPNAPKLVLNWIKREKLAGLKFFHFFTDINIAGMNVLVSRTGYTGEIGFELYTDVSHGSRLWQLLLNAGRDLGLQPCGLGARDTLRTEAGLPLHGHELHPDRVGLGHLWEFAIDWDHDFVGKDALVNRRERPDLFVVPFILDGRRKAMPGWEVVTENKVAGSVLSGVISPTLDNTPIGFAGLHFRPDPETRIYFRRKDRDALLSGKVTEIPFVKGTSRKKMAQFI